MCRFGFVSAFLVLVVAAAGCQNDQIKALEGENSFLKSEIAARDGQIVSLKNDVDDLGVAIETLKVKNDGDLAKLAKARDRIRKLELGSGPGILDNLTKEKLREIASRFPGQLEFDEPNNLLRITEAINFGSGSSNTTAKAKAALRAVAGVLKEVGGAKFRIDGHTDSDPIRKSKGVNKDNMDLSLKRARAVWVELAAGGIPREKMFCAGFSLYKPIASNETKQGKTKNRRVEIVVLPDR